MANCSRFTIACLLTLAWEAAPARLTVLFANRFSSLVACNAKLALASTYIGRLMARQFEYLCAGQNTTLF